MDYTKLLFAAEVRRLAAQLRDDAAAEHDRDTNFQHEQREQEHRRWLTQHPVTSFVTAALAQITAVQEIIEPPPVKTELLT